MITELLADPPGWVQTILWLCALYVVARFAVVGLLRTRVFRAYLTCRIHRVPLGFWDLWSCRIMGADPQALARAMATVPGLRGEERVDAMVRHGAAGGDILAVATAWGLAASADDAPTLPELCAADLRGEDVLAHPAVRRAAGVARETPERKDDAPC